MSNPGWDDFFDAPGTDLALREQPIWPDRETVDRAHTAGSCSAQLRDGQDPIAASTASPRISTMRSISAAVTI